MIAAIGDYRRNYAYSLVYVIYYYRNQFDKVTAWINQVKKPAVGSKTELGVLVTTILSERHTLHQCCYINTKVSDELQILCLINNLFIECIKTEI